MSLNREKLVAVAAGLILLTGLYFVVVGVITPSPGVHIPPTDIPRTTTAVLKPEYRRFRAEDLPPRNPFRLAEGWAQLDVLPLAPPPYPSPAHLLPPLSRSPAFEESGFLWRDGGQLPVPEASDSGAEPGGPGGGE